MLCLIYKITSINVFFSNYFSFIQPSIRSEYSSCDLSRVTSGRISPSDLPDSPLQSDTDDEEADDVLLENLQNLGLPKNRSDRKTNNKGRIKVISLSSLLISIILLLWVSHSNGIHNRSPKDNSAVDNSTSTNSSANNSTSKTTPLDLPDSSFQSDSYDEEASDVLLESLQNLDLPK